MEQIGDYLVRRLIGEGGMGKVYEAEERLSKRRVALKVLHGELAKSEDGRRLFLNEMQILAHLEHANIVRSLASIEVDGELVMVLEYLNGRTLRSELHEKGRFPWADTIRVVSAVASALAAAHGQTPPIIHRDLKPENIMMLEGGAVKVMDFGIAKVIEAMHQTNTQSVGTLQYMSPEQIDAHSIDHRADLYCLGLIFYEMLAGRAPFQSASPRQLLNLQCTAEPPPLEDDVRAGLPKGVEQLLFQLLEKAPEDRPYLAQDVVERLEPFQTAAAPTPRVSRTSRTDAGISSPRSPRTTEPDRAAPRISRTPETAREAVSQEDPSRAKTKESEPLPGKEPPRADTIALVDKVDRKREVPTGAAIAIIVALSLLAGLGAYLLRSTSAPAETTPGATASGPVFPAPPRGGGVRR
ncbi:MAG: protein kinase [Polyangiaceae bacterium]